MKRDSRAGTGWRIPFPRQFEFSCPNSKRESSPLLDSWHVVSSADLADVLRGRLRSWSIEEILAIRCEAALPSAFCFGCIEPGVKY